MKLYRTPDIYGISDNQFDTSQSYGEFLLSTFKVINTSNKNIGIYDINLLVNNQKVNQVGVLRYDSMVYFPKVLFNYPYFPIDRDNKLDTKFMCDAHSFNELTTAIPLHPKFGNDNNIDLEKDFITLTFKTTSKNFMSYIPIFNKYAKVKTFSHTYFKDEISPGYSEDFKIKEPITETI